jgi:hypothetical protein
VNLFILKPLSGVAFFLVALSDKMLSSWYYTVLIYPTT